MLSDGSAPWSSALWDLNAPESSAPPIGFILLSLSELITVLEFFAEVELKDCRTNFVSETKNNWKRAHSVFYSINFIFFVIM